MTLKRHHAKMYISGSGFAKNAFLVRMKSKASFFSEVPVLSTEILSFLGEPKVNPKNSKFQCEALAMN